MRAHGVIRLYLKRLAPNDNSKNQVYFKGSLTELNLLPTKGVRAENGRLKAALRFHWMDSAGSLHYAPGAQLILYPQYPEVRFSGFMRDCPFRPALMATREEGRLLFLGVTPDDRVIGYVAGHNSALSIAISALTPLNSVGVIEEIPFNDPLGNLLRELGEIHLKGWITGKRLRADGTLIEPYTAMNAGGYTLEAELGISQNAIAGPDFQQDIEVKQFSVNDFSSLRAKSPITLLTPEPTGGIYRTDGAIEFVKRFGRFNGSSRWDFTGAHRVGLRNETTGLRMELYGYVSSAPALTNFSIAADQLLTDHNVVAAEWRLEALVNHWVAKHAIAVYVPSMKSGHQFRFGPEVVVAKETDFVLFLRALDNGRIYYDPGIKVETSSAGVEVAHRRSQFRAKFEDIRYLYRTTERTALN